MRAVNFKRKLEHEHKEMVAAISTEHETLVRKMDKKFKIKEQEQLDKINTD